MSNTYLNCRTTESMLPIISDFFTMSVIAQYAMRNAPTDAECIILHRKFLHDEYKRGLNNMYSILKQTLKDQITPQPNEEYGKYALCFGAIYIYIYVNSHQNIDNNDYLCSFV